MKPSTARRTVRAAAWVAAAMVAAACAPSARSEPTDGFTGELQVILWDGLCRPDQPASRMNLVLDLSAERGVWGRVWPMAFDYGHGVHTGIVMDGAAEAGRLRLKVGVVMGDDTWNKGGSGMYAIDLARGPDGRLEGTYEATFEGRALAGRAYGRMKPARPVVAEGFAPPRPGEHPRLLFRKGDLEALRRRLKTPFGQAYLAKAVASWDLVNLAVLHQLTGDAKYADEAMKIVEGYLARPQDYGQEIVNEEGWWGSGGYGHRLVRVAVAFDLCFDAWPEAFRRRLTDRLMEILPQHQKRIMISHQNQGRNGRCRPTSATKRAP